MALIASSVVPVKAMCTLEHVFPMDVLLMAGKRLDKDTRGTVRTLRISSKRTRSSADAMETMPVGTQQGDFQEVRRVAGAPLKASE
jgi:hypothetical protein